MNANRKTLTMTINDFIDKGEEMTLKEARLLFTHKIVLLLIWANQQQGWQVALGRDYDEANEEFHHMKGSLHYKGLANDLCLYIEEVYQEKTEAYKALGMYWKGLHPLCRWGGDFLKADGNHFSISFEGKA